MASCEFCRIVGREADARIVHEDEQVLAFLDHRPLFAGHTLLVPREHIEALEDVPSDLLAHLTRMVQVLSRAVEEACGSQGTFIALNNKVSQSVPHAHWHVVPRTRGDGLRGFFWPRNGYESDRHADDVQERLREAIRGSTG